MRARGVINKGHIKQKSDDRFPRPRRSEQRLRRLRGAVALPRPDSQQKSHDGAAAAGRRRGEERRAKAGRAGAAVVVGVL